jgi:hypothetical protein
MSGEYSTVTGQDQTVEISENINGHSDCIKVDNLLTNRASMNFISIPYSLYLYKRGN